MIVFRVTVQGNANTYTLNRNMYFKSIHSVMGKGEGLRGFFQRAL